MKNSLPKLERGHWLILGAALTSGIMAPLGKLILFDISSPVFLFYLSVAAVGLGWPYMKARGQEFRIGTGPGIWLALFWHTLAVIVALSGLWEGMRRLNPAVAAFVSNSQVIFTFVCSWIILGEKIRGRLLPAITIVMLGMGMMTYAPEIGSSLRESVIGVLLVMLSALGFSLSDIVMKHRIDQLHMLPFVTMRNIFLSVFYGAWVWVGGFSFAIQPLILFYVAIAALLGPILARIFFAEGLRSLPTNLAIIIFQTYPIFAAIFSFLILGAIPSAQQWLGGGLVMVGIAVLLRSVMK